MRTLLVLAVVVAFVCTMLTVVSCKPKTEEGPAVGAPATPPGGPAKKPADAKAADETKKPDAKVDETKKPEESAPGSEEAAPGDDGAKAPGDDGAKAPGAGDEKKAPGAEPGAEKKAPGEPAPAGEKKGN